MAKEVLIFDNTDPAGINSHYRLNDKQIELLDKLFNDEWIQSDSNYITLGTATDLSGEDCIEI